MSQILRKVIPISILGASNVGKTSIIQQYTNQYYNTNTLSTIRYEFKFKNIKIKIDNEEKNLKLKIWDTSGQEIYFEQALISLKTSLGCLVIYDITDKKSFEIVDKWIESIYNLKDYKKFPVILIGNKSDLKDEREVSYKEGENFAKKYNIKFFECSAKEGINVKEAFQCLIDNIIQLYKDDILKEKNNKKVILKKENEKKCMC